MKRICNPWMLRKSLVIAFLVLAGCEYAHGVQRTTRLPVDGSPGALEAAVAKHPLVTNVYRWDGESFWVQLSEGDANAGLQCLDGTLEVGSFWFNRDPEPAVLTRSLQLQADLIDLLRERFSWVPTFDRWAVEWLEMEPRQAADDGQSRAEPSR